MSSGAFDLSRLIEPAASPPSAAEPPAEDAAGALRLRLAVRGWTRPIDLVEQVEAFGTLSSEVETAENSRPGQWFLSSASRRLALAGADKRRLTDAVREMSLADRADPVRLAFKRWIRDDWVPPDKLPDEQLSACANLIDWLGPQWGGPFGAAELAAEAARRRLDDDLARMTARPLIGETHRQALDKLRGFALDPAEAGVRAIYVHGGGGAGKTTLLAFLQHELLQADPPATVLKVDFDEPAIDPARMVTLNIALVDQLASTIPSLRGWADYTGGSLRRIAATQRSADTTRSSVKQKVAVEEEMIRSRGASDESSIIWNMLSPDQVPRPLLLILDTAELVLAHSDRIAAGITDWLAFLCTEGGARDLRIVIAGRDPPPAGDPASYAISSLFDRLSASGIAFADPIALSELSIEESAELLRTSGLDDEAVIAAAAEAVPGNPLLLRITADALLRGGEEMSVAVQQAHAQSKVDPASARNYLMRRLVAHVADAAARPYVLAALYLPMLTRDALEAAVIPAVDRAMNAPAEAGETKHKAKRLFAALAGTNWLTRPSLDPKCIAFNRELRDFALQLLAAMPEEAPLERDLRQLAVIHHLGKRGAQHRAFAFYHLAKLGLPTGRPRNREATVSFLRDVLAELPPAAHAWLEPREAYMTAAEPLLSAGSEPIKPAMSDADWRIYLEGDGTREGEGSQLVRDDKAREALQLYVGRPTREPGRPPTFVIRALTELGEWDSELIHPDLLEEETAREDSLSERLYWITRLSMLQRWAQPSEELVETLVRAGHKGHGPALLQLATLMVVAELATGQEFVPLPTRQAVAKLAPEIDARFLLKSEPKLLPPVLALNCSQVTVIQRDWFDRLREDPTLRGQAEGEGLAEVQERVLGLDGRPLAAVNELFHSLTRAIRVSLFEFSPIGKSLFLRGQTPEFHGPLREALLTVCGDGVVGPKTRAICDPVLAAMSIRPSEMEPGTFYERLAGNPRVWSAALVGFADQCRLLPLLAERVGAVSDVASAQQIAAGFAAWDAALSGGTSLWGQDRGQAVVQA